jgi:Cys-rich repeat protein
VSLDGLDCANDAELCGPKFRCSLARVCQRRCDTDDVCIDPDFPICNLDVGFCGECSFDEECRTGSRRYCDTTSARCVECVDASGCYVNGLAAGRYCDLTTKTCADGCRSQLECRLGQDCLGGTANEVGRCIECEPDPGDPAGGDSDCQLANPRRHCEPTKNVCVQCLVDGDCQSGQSCDLRTNQCVQCLRNTDCPGAQVCDPAQLLCVPGCVGGVGEDNCPPDRKVCDTRATGENPRGQCVECLRDADCGGLGKVCDSASMRCIPGCTSDASCPSAKPHCLAGVGPRGTCAKCTTATQAADCGPNLVCHQSTDPLTAGVCRCKGIGEPCGATSECGFRGFDANGVPQCNASRPLCIAELQCANGSRSRVLQPYCTVAGSGLTTVKEDDSCPGELAGDANGPYVNARATATVGGALSVQCVRATDFCN